MVRVGGTFIFTPVRGFVALRAGRSWTLKVPKPMSCTLPSWCSPFLIASNTPRTALSASAQPMSLPNSRRTSSTNAALFMELLPGGHSHREERAPARQEHVQPWARVSTGKPCAYEPTAHDIFAVAKFRERHEDAPSPDLPRGVMVAQVILDHFVKVRVLARQPPGKGGTNLEMVGTSVASNARPISFSPHKPAGSPLG